MLAKFIRKILKLGCELSANGKASPKVHVEKIGVTVYYNKEDIKDLLEEGIELAR